MLKLLIASCALVGALSAQPQSLPTLFAANNGGGSGWVVMFDATVLNPGGLWVTGLDVNCSSTVVTPAVVNVYVTPGSYLTNERNAAVWTLVSTGSTAGGLRNTPAFADIADFRLAAGAWGVAVQTVGVGQAYTNGNGSNQNYADANLSLSLGAALASQFLSTGSLFGARVWNGAIYYAVRGDAVAGVFGTGCAGSNGVPRLAPQAGSLPSVGQTLALALSGGPTAATAAVVALGFGKTTALGLPLPIDLAAVNMPGCQLWIDPLSFTSIGVVGGVATVTQPIPAQPSLFGLPIYHQAFVLDPGVNPASLVASNACEALIGR